MVVPHKPQSSSMFYQEYYRQQKGNGLSVFRGATVQRGKGIGSFFSKMMRGAMPLLKSGAKAAGKQLLSTGVNIAKDLIEGKDFKTSAAKNLSTGGKKLVAELTKTFDNNRKRPLKKQKRKLSSDPAKVSTKVYKKQRLSKHPNIFE